MPEWIGKTIGKVRIERLLARGGMAEVYLGTHVTLARPVAIKLLHSFIEEDPALLERFQREARVVAGLRHPNIVQVFDFDTIDGHPYIVMEYLKGPTLATYLRYLSQRKKRLPLDQVGRLLNGLTTALDYAHGQGVIHRDIKPANILLHNRTDEIPLDKTLPNDVEAIVTDFGLVRVINEASQTTSGILSGTPLYMSPEQARGDPIDHRSDIYSLGVVLYEMLAGRLPFQADNTLTVLHMHIHTTPLPIPGIPAKLQAVIDRALLKNPADRYQTSRALAIDYYRSIGMTAEAEIIQEPAPVSHVSIEPPIEPPVFLTPKPVSLPADLLELLTHSNSSVRKLAVQELVALLDSKQLGLARAAQEKLSEIAATDDSLTLRQIARQELSSRGFETDLEAPVSLTPKPASLPADLLELLSHDNSSVRKRAVQELVILLDGNHLGLARAAQEKLSEIAATDDSLTLRQIARQELSSRGFETSVPLEIQNENPIRKPARMPGKPPPSQKYFSSFVKWLRGLNPFPRLMDWKLPLPKLERRFVGGVLGIGLGIVVLAGASKLIINGIAISAHTPTATITLARPATPTPPPSITITPLLSQSRPPTSTRTDTPTPTLTSTPTSTRTPLPLFTTKPSRKRNNNQNQPTLPH